MALASMRSVRARRKCASERLEPCDAIGRFERLERAPFQDDLDGPELFERRSRGHRTVIATRKP